MEKAMPHLPQIVEPLHRIHGAKLEFWMSIYDLVSVVREYVEAAKAVNGMPVEDMQLVEAIVDQVEAEVKGHPLVPCHNDFHSYNIMKERMQSSSTRLLAIDFENVGLGDPMWDLAYLTVNLELEQMPLAPADLYVASKEEQLRVCAYVRLAMAHVAAWTGMHGDA